MTTDQELRLFRCVRLMCRVLAIILYNQHFDISEETKKKQLQTNESLQQAGEDLR